MVLGVLLAAAIAANDTDWVADLELNGWTYHTRTEHVAVFSRPAVQVAPFRRLWVRYEYPATQTSPYGDYRSSASLEEVDCTQQRSRTLQDVRYAESNLQGDVTYTSAPEKPEWSYALPSTIQAYYVALACVKPAS